MRKSFIFATFVAAALFLTGCANSPYKTFYKQNQGAENYRANPDIILGNEEPRIIKVNSLNLLEENIKLWEDGYISVGYSSFIGELQGEKGAIEQAKALNASVVLIRTPITNGELPTSQYGGGVRVEQAASYWVKTKINTKLFGVGSQPLTDEMAKKLGSNKAVHIQYVVKNSPAFFADVMKGDLITSIDGEIVYDRDSFGSSVKDKMGKQVEIILYRDGKQLKKYATLGAWKQ